MKDEGSPTREAGAGLHLAVRVLRVIAAVLAAASTLIVVWVVIARFLHPAETEWMTGSIRDEVDRLRAGQPLYAAPSQAYVPYIYPPLYFWLSSVVAKATSTAVACRLVSITATVVTVVAIARISRAVGASARWAWAGGALYVGTFSYTMYCFDLERVDALESAFATSAVALLMGGKENPKELLRAAGAGVLFGLAYFAKQPGLFIFASCVGGLLFAREWKRAGVVFGAGLVTALSLGIYAQSTTHGWFSYYVLKMPASHGISPPLVTVFWLVDAPKAFVLAAGSFGLVSVSAYRILRRQVPPWRATTFAAVVGGAMIGAFLMRAHVGGWINVVIAWTPFGCAAAAIAGSRALDAFDEPRARAAIEIGLLTAFALQLALWFFDPSELAPGPKDDAAEGALARLVTTLEKEGEVVVTSAGGLSSPRHFHAAALYDVLRVGDPAPADYLAALRERKYSAMVVSAPNETMCAPASCAETSIAVMENYFVAARLPPPVRPSRVGFEVRSAWVLRPRKIPLKGVPLEKLDARQRTEAAIAEMRSALGGSLGDPTLPQADIEEIAAAEATRDSKL